MSVEKRTAETDHESERLGRVALNRSVEPGNAQVAALVDEIGAARVVDLFSGGRRDEFDPAAELEQAEARRFRFVIPGDAEWPGQLGALAHCSAQGGRGGVPIGLWVRGEMPLAEATRSAVAVVGARAATPYGIEQSGALSADLATHHITVVSGAAYGIDQAAHRGSLASGGLTVAVLPCGADRAYPAAHERLLAQIADHGLVVSEQGLGTMPTRERFLARNRLLAALSDGTVVVEAARRSGALTTARWSTELGRLVMAVPGPLTSVTSAGAHDLMRAGHASMITSALDILEDLGELATSSEMSLEADGVATSRTRPIEQTPGQDRSQGRTSPPAR